MPFAANGQISQSPVEGGIEISELQYQDGLAGILNGKVISIANGFEVLNPPESESPEPGHNSEPPSTIPEALAAKYKDLDRKRREVEEGGILFGGMPLKTDRQTAAIITAAYVKASADPGFSIANWKFSDGIFGPLDAATIIAAGDAITAHVQSAFDREAELTAVLQAMTSFEQINRFDVDAQW